MSGTGPGEIAPDGSAVDFYASMPDDERHAALVHGAIPAGASIVELGAGAGRVTRPLVARGHPVVAVDESAGMLARITGAQTVRSRIEDLDLGRRFDVVLMMSYLISYGRRGPLLDACRRHVAADGQVIIQREPDGWYERAAPQKWERDGVRYRMYDVTRLGEGEVTASIEYRLGERVWTHSFHARGVDDEELLSVLGAAGLRLDRFLDEERGWLVARPVHRA